MAEQLIIDPKSVSVSKIITDLEDFLASKPDATLFAPFFTTATGKSLTEIVAGLGGLLSYNNISARRENFIQFAINRSSLIGISENLGVSVPRGSNEHLTLTATPNVTTVLPKFTIIGAAKDKDIVVLQDTPVTSGVQLTMEVAIGEFASETVIVPDDDIATFRYVTANVSEDLRVLLNGTEVNISNKLEDMQNDFYAVISNPLGAVDISSLNQATNAFQYTTGDNLVIEFVKLEDFTYKASDLSVSFGTLDSFIQSQDFIDKETNKQIAVNSPLRHETQARIRGRLDFKKIFLGLDSRIVDTNQRDISAAVVELTYVRDDNLLFTEAEKDAFITELRTRILMGIDPPPMIDPILVPLKLAFQLTLLSNDGDPVTAVDNVMVELEKKLGQSLDFLSIESSVEKSETEEGSGIRFIETARLQIDSDTWTPVTGFQRGQFVNPITANGFVYELQGIIYSTGDSEPTFPTTDLETVIDNDIVWQAEPVDLCEALFTWTSSTPKVLDNLIIPTIPNGKMYRAIKYVNRSFGNEEIQLIEFDIVPNLGSWRIHFDTEKTVDLPFTATALDVQTALRNLTALTDVEVTGDYTVGFTLTFTGVDANKSQPQVEFTNAGFDEIQIIGFTDIPNGGDWGIDFDGQQTAVLPYNINAADLKIQLELLSNIDSVDVIGDFSNGFTVTFLGSNEKTDVPLMTQYVLSDVGVDEQQTITFDAIPDSGTWRIHYEDEFTGDMAFDASAAIVAGELNGLNGLDGVLVTGNYSIGFTIDFAGASGKKAQPLLVENNAGINAIQTLIFSTTPDQGFFRIEFDGEETIDIPFNSTTAQMESYLESLSNISSVSVSGDFVSGIQIEWTGVDGLQSKSLVTLDDLGTDEVQQIAWGAEPTTGGYSVTFDSQTTSVIPYTNGTSEIQTVNFSIVPDAGAFTLVFEAQQTASIPFGATAATVKAALEGLPNVSLVSVTGTFATGFVVTFLGDNINRDVAIMAVGANTLESATVPILVSFVETVKGIDGNAQALEDALNALSNIDSVSVVGDYAGDFDISFDGDLVSKQNVNQIVIATNTTGETITPSTIIDGQFPSQNIKRLGADVVITTVNTQTGLVPANELLDGVTPIVITVLETITGEDPKTNLDKSGAEVSVTVTEDVKGEVPANNLLQGILPVVITPSTLVDAAEAEPTWPVVLGETVQDGDIIWVMVEYNGTPDVWQPDTDYDQSSYIQPSVPVFDATPTQLMAQVQSFVGTSDSIEPVFPTTIGDTVIDNNMTWITHNPELSPTGLGFAEYYEVTQTVTVS